MLAGIIIRTQKDMIILVSECGRVVSSVKHTAGYGLKEGYHNHFEILLRAQYSEYKMTISFWFPSGG